MFGSSAGSISVGELLLSPDFGRLAHGAVSIFPAYVEEQLLIHRLVDALWLRVDGLYLSWRAS